MPKDNKLVRENYIVSIDNYGIISVIFKGKNPYNIKNKDEMIKDTTGIVDDALNLIHDNFFEKYRIFVDYSVEDTDYCFPPDNRKIMIKALMENKFDKMAITGEAFKKHTAPLLIVKAITMLIPKIQIKYFRNKNEAFAWLKKEE